MVDQITPHRGGGRAAEGVFPVALRAPSNTPSAAPSVPEWYKNHRSLGRQKLRPRLCLPDLCARFTRVSTAIDSLLPGALLFRLLRLLLRTLLLLLLSLLPGALLLRLLRLLLRTLLLLLLRLLPGALLFRLLRLLLLLPRRWRRPLPTGGQVVRAPGIGIAVWTVQRQGDDVRSGRRSRFRPRNSQNQAQRKHP